MHPLNSAAVPLRPTDCALVSLKEEICCRSDKVQRTRQNLSDIIRQFQKIGVCRAFSPIRCGRGVLSAAARCQLLTPVVGGDHDHRRWKDIRVAARMGRALTIPDLCAPSRHGAQL
jgi:hypothetical protein